MKVDKSSRRLTLGEINLDWQTNTKSIETQGAFLGKLLVQFAAPPEG